jgi:hypothetical protein
MGTGAERDRLTRALAQGPGRRMRADEEMGRGPERGDLEQAARYTGQLAALDRGEDGAAPVLAGDDGDGLGLDRIERSD